MATKIIGAGKHERRLKNLQKTVPDEIYKALYASGQLIQVTAQKSIIQGAVSGPEHVPSRPGEPPNRDTSELDTSIKVYGNKAKLQVQTIAEAPHSADVEYGHENVVERPYMRPAVIKTGPERNKLVRQKVKVGVGKSGG